MELGCSFYWFGDVGNSPGLGLGGRVMFLGCEGNQEAPVKGLAVVNTAWGEIGFNG